MEVEVERDQLFGDLIEGVVGRVVSWMLLTKKVQTLQLV
jgi:hypothetical protein